jgi:hypothetical protein
MLAVITYRKSQVISSRARTLPNNMNQEMSLPETLSNGYLPLACTPRR